METKIPKEIQAVNDIIKELKAEEETLSNKETELSEQVEYAHSEINKFYQLDDKHVNQIFNLTDLANMCLMYEDLSNKRPEAVSSALMSVAYEELKFSADEYSHFVRFIARRRRGSKNITTQDGIRNYIERLGKKVQDLSDKIKEITNK